MRLIGVDWDGDIGVVDLDTAKVIMYCWGVIESCSFNIPCVKLEDEDFRPLVAEEDKADHNALYDVANWSNVPALLKLDSFNLESRLIQPE